MYWTIKYTTHVTNISNYLIDNCSIFRVCLTRLISVFRLRTLLLNISEKKQQRVSKIITFYWLRESY